MDVQIINSKDARIAWEYCRMLGIPVRIFGKGDMVDQPVFKDDMWIERVTDYSTLSRRSRKAISAIKSKVPIKGVMIYHETTNLLPAPKKEPIVIPWRTIAKFTAAGIASVLSTAFSVVTTVIGVGFMVFTAALIDPIVVVCLECGTLIEVDSWFGSSAL